MSVRSLLSITVGIAFNVIAIVFVITIAGSNSSLAQGGGVQDQQDAQFAPQGAQTCLTCHNNPTVTSILGTAHGDSSVAGSPFANQACESCHGASPDHVSTMQAPAVVFEGSQRYSVSEVEVQNQMCLNCHQSRDTVHWSASEHQAADLACVTCHTIHASQTCCIERASGDEGICLTCHLEQRSQLNRRSHHPVAEGLMSCNDCHNPHGSDTVAMLTSQYCQRDLQYLSCRKTRSFSVGTPTGQRRLHDFVITRTGRLKTACCRSDSRFFVKAAIQKRTIRVLLTAETISIPTLPGSQWWAHPAPIVIR